MRIASFTMVGQYPHGIGLHARNLRWALGADDHVFVVTLPEIIAGHGLADGGGVTYVPFPREGEGVFIKFWKRFPQLLRGLGVEPEWFLFMEQDIWFYRRPGPPPSDGRELVSYLPPQWQYHAVTVNGEPVHPRVWEGGMLVPGDVVRRAVERGISFTSVRDFFCQQDEAGWERKMGGKVGLRHYVKSDTFDEFGLYCVLVEGTRVAHADCAVHLRGPETLHRKFPQLYDDCTEADLGPARDELKYMCVYAGLAPYHIDGHWRGTLDWGRMAERFQAEYRKLLPTAAEWLRPDEHARLLEITGRFLAAPV